MTVDFRKLLDKPMDEIKRPPSLPAGTYFGTVTKYEFGESNNKKTPYLRLLLNVTSAGEDVDQEALKEIDLSKKQLRKDFYITPDAEYRIKEFLESCQIPTTGRALGEAIPDCMNAPVVIEVTLRPNQNDPEAPPNNDVGNLKGQQD